MVLEDVPKIVVMIYALLVFIILTYLFQRNTFIKGTKGKLTNRLGYAILILILTLIPIPILIQKNNNYRTLLRC